MKTNIVLGKFRDSTLTIELTSKRDVMIVCPARYKVKPIPLWRRVPTSKTFAEIVDYLSKRDAKKFADAGGVDWATEIPRPKK